jgi:hypothetical protein
LSKGQGEAAALRKELANLRPKNPEETNPIPPAFAEPGRQALAHRAAGRFEEAVKTGEELLALRRKELGLEHVDTLSAIYNLGVSLRMAHRAKESASMLETCLELRRKVLGPKAPTILSTMR